jgi:methionyl-tRNA formyltransferase
VRLAFFGTTEFAVPALEAMADSVALVVTQPDRPTGRGLRLHASPVKTRALALGLPVESPEKSRAPEFVARLRSLDLDALLVAAYGQILSVAVLESARRGGINLHGSVLPRWRGAAPIQRAILAGDTETGVTLMQMDRGMDTGDIIAVRRTPIGPDETYGELQARLADLAAGMAREWMPRVVAGDYPREPQDDAPATLAAKVTKEEAGLDFGRAAAAEYARFRAFTPAPGAYLSLAGGPLKLHACRLAAGEAAGGTVLSLQPLTVAFAGGALELQAVQPAGKPRMAGRDWANGARLRVGDRLEAPPAQSGA